MNGELEQARAVRDRLRKLGMRIVLAESATAGRIAATLSVLPGISEFLCGSFVVYRNDSKQRWLGVPESLLESSDSGPVSADCSERLAYGAMERTPEAEIALAITGDVGPGASATTDGKIFLHWLERDLEQHESCHSANTPVRRSIAMEHTLQSPPPVDALDCFGRLARLTEATEAALRLTVQFLED